MYIENYLFAFFLIAVLVVLIKRAIEKYNDKKRKDTTPDKPIEDVVEEEGIFEPVGKPAPDNFVRGGSDDFQEYTLNVINTLRAIDHFWYVQLIEEVKYITVSATDYDGSMYNQADVIYINFPRARIRYNNEMEYMATLVHEIYHSLNSRNDDEEELEGRIIARDFLVKHNAPDKSINKFNGYIEAMK